MKNRASPPCYFAAALLALATLDVSHVNGQKASVENSKNERFGFGHLSHQWAADFNDPFRLEQFGINMSRSVQNLAATVAREAAFRESSAAVPSATTSRENIDFSPFSLVNHTPVLSLGLQRPMNFSEGDFALSKVKPRPRDPFWDLNGTTAGSGGPSPTGIWSTSNASWNTNAAGTGAVNAWTNGNDAAVFSAGSDATGSYTVTVSGTITAGSITFEEGTVTLAGTATPVLTIQTAGGITINSTINGTTTFDSTLGNVVLAASQNWANNSSQAFNINSGVIASGSSTLTLNGSGSGGATFAGVLGDGTGTLALTVNTTGGVTILSGDNTYSGATTVTAGVLNIRHSDALGDTGSTTTTTVSSGAALEMQNGIAVDNESLTISGTGISNGGALRNVSDNNSWAGTITLADVAGTVRINSDSGTLTIGGNITEAAGNQSNRVLTFGGAGNITVNGIIGGSNDDVALTKDGSGTLTLNGLNTYPEKTTINGGVLEVNTLADGGLASSIGTSGSASTNLEINGGTLRYTGTGNSTNRNYTIGVNGATLDSSGTGAVMFTNTTGLNYSGSGSRTFTLTGSNTGANTLRGGIGDPGGASTTSLIKNGTGNWTIAGNSGYNGTTTINSGTLTVDDDMGSTSAGRLNSTISITVNNGGTLALSGVNTETNRLNNAAGFVLNGGTFKTGGLSEGSTSATGLGALTLTATSTIDFGTSNTSLLRFTGLGAHTDTTVLQLTNWNGVPITGGSGDRLLFSGDPTEFTGLYDQNEVSFNGVFGYTTFDFGSSYEVTAIAVPEQPTWISGALVVGLIALSQRRRLQGLLAR